MTRICLDMLRSRRHQPLDVELVAPDDPEQEAVLADEVGFAMLVVLERCGARSAASPAYGPPTASSLIGGGGRSSPRRATATGSATARAASSSTGSASAVGNLSRSVQ